MSIAPNPSSQPAASPHYRAVTLWAVFSVVSAVATLPMLLLPWPASLILVAVFAAAAIYLGRKALRQIQRTPEEYTGTQLAKTGIWLGAVLGLLFSGWLTFFRNEVPPGYQAIDYSVLEPDAARPGKPPNAALEMKDKGAKVYIRGYIVPPPRGQLTGITKFSICRDSDMCKFNMKVARPEDQIHVELTGDLKINFSSYQIGVGGKFMIDEDQSPQPYYKLEADYVYQ